MAVSHRLAALKERFGTKRSLVVIAIITAAMLTSGVVFAAWLANGTGNGQAQAGTAQELEVTPGTPSDLLFPGGTAEVALRITNPNPYPVVVTNIDQDGDITSDAEGCAPENHGVTFANQAGTWGVAAGGFTDIALPDAAAMSLESVNACQGAVFTIPLSATGNAGEVAASDWYPDDDGDGYGDSSASPVSLPSAPEGFVADNTDCDDTDATRFPGAPEVGDGVDNDCNGIVDDGLSTFYADADGDGFGDPGSPLVDTSPPPGYVIDDSDCDDSDASINPAATDTPGDGIDQDCDGVDAAADADGDGFDSTVDCDDGDASINPGAIDIPGDGIDQDCDGSDAGVDADADGYDTTVDCDDTDPNNYPGGIELVDGQDNDCDLEIDEGLDTDGDGISNTVEYGPLGFFSARDTDGDGLADFEDFDSDGDGWTDLEEPWIDPDGDGVENPYDLSSFPNPPDDALRTDYELCNGVDDDLDGLIDEDDSDIGIGGCVKP